MESVLQKYKHRYRNISIRNLDSSKQPIKVSIGDFDIYMDIIGDKAIVFKDNDNKIYHMSFSTDKLDILTEVFVDDTNIKDPKILVVENDSTNQGMIVSKKGVKKFKVNPIKDDKGNIITYKSDNFNITNTGVIITGDI